MSICSALIAEDIYIVTMAIIARNAVILSNGKMNNSKGTRMSAFFMEKIYKIIGCLNNMTFYGIIWFTIHKKG